MLYIQSLCASLEKKNMSTSRLIFGLIFIVFSELSFGQIKEFKWGRTTGSFDSTKYLEHELRNTYGICYPGAHGYGIDLNYAKNYDDVKKWKLSIIKKQYKTAKSSIKSLEVVEIEIFENAKICALYEIESIYTWHKRLIKVYKNPKRYRNKSSCDSCFKYIDMIFVDDSTLLRNWLFVLKERYGHYSNFKKYLQGEYYNHLNSQNKIEIAKFAILNDGFRECTRRREIRLGCASQCFGEFRKLFITFDIRY